MAKVINEARNNLELLKKCTEKSYLYFKKNYERYNEFVRFICKSNLTTADIAVLNDLDRPQMEFNIIEAHINRLVGEFVKMDPNFSIRKKDGANIQDDRLPELLEAHYKACFFGGDKDSLSQAFYRDLLYGGFSVGKMYTDWADSKSFLQKIFVERVFDPTLCGFDPLARESHKGDGKYCFEIFPRSAEEAAEEFGKEILSNANFTRTEGQFSWSYYNQQEKIILFCEFFKKEFKKEKIYKLANGHVVTKDQYENVAQLWREHGHSEQIPAIVNQRYTTIERIDKYLFTGNEVIKHDKTDYDMLPLVFFDGNSRIVRENQNTYAEQFTRPYAYHARDAQRMKNFAGQSLCNELETIVQHKWIAPIEAVPDNVDYQLAYTMPQKATVMLYNAFKDNDPNIPIVPPREVARVPIPPELSNTFMMCDKLIQTILGTFDAAMGNQGNEAVSGKAIREGAMNSNAASMPYMMGFIEGWNRLGNMYLNLLPKYYVTPRTLPIVTSKGKREYYEINKGNNVKFDYDLNCLEVTVEAGVNFAVQKQIALEMLLKMMQSSELFNQFMNTEGLEVLLDNLDIRGIDNLKVMAEKFMENMKKQQEQQAKQQEGMPSPQEMMQMQMQQEQGKQDIEKAKIMQKDKEAQLKAQVAMTEIDVNAAEASKEADIKFVEVMSKIQGADVQQAIDQERVDAENARTSVEMAINLHKHHRETEVHQREGEAHDKAMQERSDNGKDEN